MTPNASIFTNEEMSVLAGWEICGVSRATLPSMGVQNRVVLVEADFIAAGRSVPFATRWEVFWRSGWAGP